MRRPSISAKPGIHTFTSYVVLRTHPSTYVATACSAFILTIHGILGLARSWGKFFVNIFGARDIWLGVYTWGLEFGIGSGMIWREYLLVCLRYLFPSLTSSNVSTLYIVHTLPMLSEEMEEFCTDDIYCLQSQCLYFQCECPSPTSPSRYAILLLILLLLSSCLPFVVLYLLVEICVAVSEIAVIDL
jgi:hypothetical protein